MPLTQKKTIDTVYSKGLYSGNSYNILYVN